MRRIQRRLFEILELVPEGNRLARAITGSLIGLIGLNVIAVALETVDNYSVRFGWFFRPLEAVSVGVFTAEYILRVWACTLHDRYRGAFWGRLRFALTPLALVDLASFLPFYLPIAHSPDLRFVRAIRMLRLFRVVKIARYSESATTLGNVLRAKREPLVLTAFAATTLLVLAAGAVYVLEHEAQPGAFPNIPAGLWWAVVTLTTIGYGDVYPVTALGKMLAAVVAFLGIGVFALPAGIIASGFIEEARKRSRKRICPHCGRDIEEPAAE